MNPKPDVATKIAADLFRNGIGEQAHRLVLVDRDDRDLGGWCRQAVVDTIRQRLKQEQEQAKRSTRG